MFTYVTGNPNKIASAKKQLSNHGIDFVHQELSLTEIQANNIEDIALHKAREAYGKLSGPVLVNDAGWGIAALKGFPGPYMHHIREWFSNDDFFNLMNGKKDRLITLTTVLAFKDDKCEKVFRNVREGVILDTPSGIGRVEFDRIMNIFQNSKLLISTMIAAR